MLTWLRIRNFKAWADTGHVRLAPLTVIFGANSAGKSSLGHLLLALKQTASAADRRRALHLGDDKALIDLGTFAEVVHNHDLTEPLAFSLGWRLPSHLEVTDPISQTRFAGNEVRLDVELVAGERAQPLVQRLRYELLRDRQVVLAVDSARLPSGAYDIHSEQITLVPKASGHASPLDAPDKFYRISDQSRARFQNADFLSDLAFETEGALTRLYHLGPLRDYPRRIYSWSGETPESVGSRGELAIAAILAATEQDRRLSRGNGKQEYRFDEFIAQWLQELGVIDRFEVRPIAEGRREYEVLVRAHATASEVKLTDVGFGVSHLLPALTQVFYCPPHSTVWIEQPEIHLHPQVQASLADAFICATQARENGKARSVQLIVESHSEHFLNRLQRRVAEGEVSPEHLAVYFARRTGSAVDLDPLRLNEYGEIENWPEHFFGDEMADIAARTMAAMRRRKTLRREPDA